jgi:hypothetical protein
VPSGEPGGPDQTIERASGESEEEDHVDAHHTHVRVAVKGLLDSNYGHGTQPPGRVPPSSV